MKKVTNEKSETALSGRLWKWLIGLAALCLAAFLVIWYMPHSKELSWSGTAVEYRTDDAGYAAEHGAVIEGTYTWNRAGKQAFEGNFWIDGLDMDSGTRARLTLEPGADQFYDSAGQPRTMLICGVIQGPDGQGAAALLWDEYTVENGHISASLEQGRRFICIGELSRQDAVPLVDTLKQQIVGT